MKLQVKGITGEVLYMSADYEQIATTAGVERIVTSYEVTLWDGEKEITFPQCNPDDIKFA